MKECENGHENPDGTRFCGTCGTDRWKSRSGGSELIQKLKTYLQQLYGMSGFLELPLGAGFLVQRGSTVTVISIGAVTFRGQQTPIVSIWAPVAKEVTRIDASSRELLESSAKMAFGGFGYDPGTKQVVFKTSLLAQTLDLEELHIAVEMIGCTADQYDEIIPQKVGGKKANEA
ncbi:MAG: hypothetical protein HYX78_06120 [Armatimonadetes bacterium]|nr:hypothetical protein [Armatimonadota bacterium]